MTRSQVRAATRRMRDHVEEIEEEAGELNLVPYMDIVTNIIIFLLASVVNQVALGNINVSSPTIQSGGGGETDTPPEKPPLNLTITVGATGYIVGASGGVLPNIPKLPNGQYDYKTLTTKLKEIKSNPDNAEETKATFNADANIAYDIVIATLDAMRQAEDGKILFPDVNFAAGIQEMAGALTPELSRLAGKKAIRSFARKLAEPEVIKDLNITPMMDMMTIILVFLLKSFSSTTATITFDSNLQVPKSFTELKPKLAVTVTVTKKVILVEGDAIAPINAGRVDPAVKRDGENGYFISPLVEILEKHARREKKVADMTGQKFEAQLMLVADQTTPYRMLTEIIYSCGQAGYANYRLLVLKAKGE